MYTGEYNHTVDAKGRLIVPSRFRELLGDEFMVTKGFDGCLFVFSNDEWVAFSDKFRDLPLSSKDARKLTRFFFAGASSCEVDKQGRILIPPTLREYADLQKDVVSTGAREHIEIWNKDRWQEVNAYDDLDEIAERMEELGIRI